MFSDVCDMCVCLANKAVLFSKNTKKTSFRACVRRLPRQPRLTMRSLMRSWKPPWRPKASPLLMMRSWKPPWRRPKANLLLILILITTATAHAVATPDSCNAAATDGGGAAAAAATAAPATVHSTNHAIGATTGPARFAAGGCSVHCHSFRSRAEGSMVTEFSTDALKQECAKHHMVKDTVASVEQC